MFKLLSSLVVALAFLCSSSIAQSLTSVRIASNTNTIPGFHSGAFAQRGSKLVFIGGRTNGLHGFSSNDGFEKQYANNRVIVVDTSSWSSSIAGLSQLPLQVADPLRSTNMQYVQDGNKLYMCGGFGWDSIQNKFVTFSTLSVIDIDQLITLVSSGDSIAPAIRQISDTIFTVCGGEMRKLGNRFMIIGGHDFRGRYSDPPTPLFTQRYHRRIRRFRISDVSNVISIQNYSDAIDSAAFHRRDMIVAPTVNSANKEEYALLGGVFTADNIPYQHPVFFDTVTHQVNSSFEQKMNQYTCAVISLRDSLSDRMYQVLPGGMSLNEYTQGTGYVPDSLVPFVKSISVLFYNSSTFNETVLATQMPDYLGTNSVFVPSPALSLYENGVIRIPVYGQEFFAGYLIGGIRGTGPNFMPSTVNDTVYRVYLNFASVNIQENQNENAIQFFPNPATETVSFKIDEPQVTVSLFNNEHKLVKEIKLNRKAGLAFSFSVNDLKPGIYFAEIRSLKDTRRGKFLVISE